MSAIDNKENLEAMLECIEAICSRDENENPSNVALVNLCRSIRHTMSDRDRWYCTKDHPMPVEVFASGMRVTHVKTRVLDSIDGYPGGDIEWVECCSCGVKWKREVAQ